MRNLRYPVGGAWPLLMQSDMAAAYLDEPSRDRFVEKVREGRYPQPLQHRGDADKWKKEDLDRIASGSQASLLSGGV